jgi:hypothetical protein
MSQVHAPHMQRQRQVRSPRQHLSPNARMRAFVRFHQRRYPHFLFQHDAVQHLCPNDMHTYWTFPLEALIQPQSTTTTTMAVPIQLRGLVARAALYVRQQNTQCDAAAAAAHDNDSSNDSGLLALDDATLHAWHERYPVTQYEYDMHQFVHWIQGTVNPLIWFPQNETL